MSDEEEDDAKKTSPRQLDAKYIAALAALIASVVGLANSCLAYRKAEQESLARNSYKVTALAIERLSDESKLNHDEVVSLRKYLLEHIASGAVAQQLDPPPPAPPVIESRPAPVQVSRGSRGARYFPAKASSVASAVPSTLASARVVEVEKAAPRPPAQMPGEWPEP